MLVAIFSPCMKLKLVIMAIPGSAYHPKNIRDHHQYPDTTLDNRSRTTAVFSQGDLNPDKICFITSAPAFAFTLNNIMHRQYYHMLHWSLLLWAAQIFQSQRSSHANCLSSLWKSWHTQSAYFSWSPCLSSQVLPLFLLVYHIHWLYNLGLSIGFLFKLLLHSCSHMFL